MEKHALGKEARQLAKKKKIESMSSMDRLMLLSDRPLLPTWKK